MKKTAESSASTTTELTVSFDIYETNITGCHSDTVSWALNVTNVVSGNVVTEGHGKDKGESTQEKNATQDNDMLSALNIYAFTIVQVGCNFI